jgi:hypothetical protein
MVVSNTYCVVFLFGFVCLRFVYSMFPVFLDCPFLIAADSTKVKMMPKYKTDPTKVKMMPKYKTDSTKVKMMPKYKTDSTKVKIYLGIIFTLVGSVLFSFLVFYVQLFVVVLCLMHNVAFCSWKFGLLALNMNHSLTLPVYSVPTATTKACKCSDEAYLLSNWTMAHGFVFQFQVHVPRIPPIRIVPIYVIV